MSPTNLNRKLVRGAGCLIATLALGGVAPALAAASSCPTSASSKLLEEFGDTAHYTLLSGSTFDSGTAGWTLDGAEVVATTGAKGNPHALQIPANASAVSPAFCVSSEYPSFRFFARQLSGGWGSGLSVSLRFTDAYGFVRQTGSVTVQPHSGWTLSPVLGLATALPLWMPGATLKVQLVFQSNWAGSYAIDGVFIDPYSR